MEDQVNDLFIPEKSIEQERIPLPAGLNYTYDEVITQNKSLSDELAQCKADKDFVWGLWKQLQSNKPDISDAIQNVLNREKEKSEQKDIKILAILKRKDDEIKSLQSMSNDLENELKTSSERLTKLIYDQTQWGSTVLELESRIKKQNETLMDLQQEWHDKLILKEKDLVSSNKEKEALKKEIDVLYSDSTIHVKDLKLKLIAAEEAMKISQDEFQKQQQSTTGLKEELILLKQKISVQDRHSADLAKDIAKEKKKNEKYKQFAEGLKNDSRKRSEDLKNAEDALRQQLKQIEKQNTVLENMDILQRESQQAMKEMQSSHQMEVSSLKESIETLMRSLKTAREENTEQKNHIDQIEADHQLTIKRKDTNIERLKYVSDANSILNESLHHRNQTDLESVDGHLLSKKDANHIEENLKIMSAALKEKSRDIALLETELIERRHQDISGNKQNFEAEHYKKASEKLQEIVEAQSYELEETRQAHLSRLERYKTLKADYKLVVELLKTYDDKAFLNGLEARRSSTPKRHHRDALNEHQSLSIEAQLSNYREECHTLIERQNDLEDERSELKVECAKFQSMVNELNLKLDEKCKEIEKHRQDSQRKQHYISPGKINVLDNQVQAWMDKARYSEDRLADVEMINEKLLKQKSILEREIRDMESELRKTETLDVHLQTDLDSYDVERVHKPFKTFKTAQTSPIKDHFAKRLFDQCTQTTGDSSSSDESTTDETLREQPISYRRNIADTSDFDHNMRSSYLESAIKDVLPKPVVTASPVNVRNRKGKQTRADNQKQNKTSLIRISSMEKQITVLREAKQSMTKDLLDAKAIQERQQGELVSLQQKLFVSKQTIQRQNVEVNKLTSEKEHVTKEQKKEDNKTRQKDSNTLRELEERLRTSAENYARVSLESKTMKRENEEIVAKLKDYSERLLKLDRMLHQKRLHIDDLKEKVKTSQNELTCEKESNEQIKKKLKTITDREGQRQTFIDNLKAKLTESMKESADLQQTNVCYKEELSKKMCLLKDSQALCLKAEHAIVEIETAYKHKLANAEKGNLLDEKKLNLEIETLKTTIANYQNFIKSLYDELMRQIHDCRLVLKERQRKIIEREKKKSMKDDKKSMKEAKNKACNILNISNDDLATFMVADETEEEEHEFSEAVEMDIRERLEGILTDKKQQNISTLLFEDVMQLVSLAFRFTYLEKNGIEDIRLDS